MSLLCEGGVQVCITPPVQHIGKRRCVAGMGCASSKVYCVAIKRLAQQIHMKMKSPFIFDFDKVLLLLLHHLSLLLMASE